MSDESTTPGPMEAWIAKTARHLDVIGTLARLKAKLLDDVIGYGHARQLHPSVPFGKHRKPVADALDAYAAAVAASARVETLRRLGHTGPCLRLGNGYGLCVGCTERDEAWAALAKMIGGGE